MQRYFVPPSAMQSERVVIEGGDARHIARVMRMSSGMRIIVCDGEGRVWEVELLAVRADRVVGRRVAEREETAEPPIPIVLVQALLKGDKMDWLVQKATELGVTALYPFVAERSVARLDGASDKAAHRQSRWQAIAKEAAEQSGRSRMPTIARPIGVGDVEAVLGPALRGHRVFIADEALACRGDAPSLFMCLERIRADAANVPVPPIAVIIGPEGGFTDAERERFAALGAEPVGLGRRILRAETAALFALSLITATAD